MSNDTTKPPKPDGLLRRLGGAVRRNPIKSGILLGAAFTVGRRYYDKRFNNGSPRNDDDGWDDDLDVNPTNSNNGNNGNTSNSGNTSSNGNNGNIHIAGGNSEDSADGKQGAKRKKRVLVIPFHRINIVEKRKKDFRSVLGEKIAEYLSSQDGDDLSSTAPVEMEANELVDVIHEAASDPNIVALYGTFGHGFGFKAGGWAHLEEVRNALKVFRDSHRVHRDPNLTHEPVLKRVGNFTRKPMYAYADTFSSPLGAAGTKEFYLASVFTHIQLQPHGELSLFGLHTTNFFIRDFLDKYGVQVHVFKHGLYKNFANLFTERAYTNHHKENVANIVNNINSHVWYGIYHDRRKNLAHHDIGTFWKTVQEAGTLTSAVAHQIGFIDYMPLLDPLEQLVKSNKSTEDREEMKNKWGKSTDLDQFAASKMVSVTQYRKRVQKRKKQRDKARVARWKAMNDTASSSASASNSKSAKDVPSMLSKMLPSWEYDDFFSIFGQMDKSATESDAKDGVEKVAVLKVGGAITDTTARTVEKALRKLKKREDVKCLVLRVDSPGGAITACETILHEVKDLPQKVVVSFGNTSASGGYYISTAADRIFASPTTVTGSIGVFLLKLDLTKLAAKYGIRTDSVSTGVLAGSYDSFTPMNKSMEENFSKFSDRAYLHFKSLVSEGRSLDMDAVESIAQGRVWTGQQAKEIGLVDELGGLDRAIAYAQREHTTTGDAQVIDWPPTSSPYTILQRILGKSRGTSGNAEGLSILSELATLIMDDHANTESSKAQSVSRHLGGLEVPRACTGIMLTIDENAAIRCFLSENDSNAIPHIDDFPDDFWV